MPKSFNLSINDIIRSAHTNAVNKGFWDASQGEPPQRFAESIALIHSELSEALEDYRAGEAPNELKYEPNGKPIGIPSELADVIIRIADLCGYHDIDLEKAIADKMMYNETRPHMHGKIL